MKVAKENVRKIKLDHATNQMVNVIAVVKMATKEISVKSVKKIIGCRPAVSSIQLGMDFFIYGRNSCQVFFS